jgi:hypothetical protein
MAAEGRKASLYIAAVTKPVGVHGTFPASACAVRVIPAWETESANYSARQAVCRTGEGGGGDSKPLQRGISGLLPRSAVDGTKLVVANRTARLVSAVSAGWSTAERAGNVPSTQWWSAYCHVIMQTTEWIVSCIWSRRSLRRI